MEEKSDAAEAAGTEPDFGRRFDEVAGLVWEDALRFALDLDHAPARCRWRSCQKEGACRMIWSEGRPLACGGGDVSADTIRTACVATWFGALMIMRCLYAPASPPADG